MHTELGLSEDIGWFNFDDFSLKLVFFSFCQVLKLASSLSYRIFSYEMD